MDLIFWRHAEAEDWTDGCDDMQRALTSRGEKQAKRMASWLDRQLPEGTRVNHDTHPGEAGASPAIEAHGAQAALMGRYASRGNHRDASGN